MTIEERTQKIEAIEAKVKKLRMLSLTGDQDAQVGIKLAMDSAVFFREHGQEIIDLMKGDA